MHTLYNSFLYIVQQMSLALFAVQLQIFFTAKKCRPLTVDTFEKRYIFKDSAFYLD